MRKVLFILLLNLLALSVFSQKIVYDLDFMFYFDNREYHSPYSVPQSLIGVRLSPQIGLEIVEKDSSIHQIWAGIHYIQPIGNEYKDLKFLPTVYYRFEGNRFDFNFGTVPFKHLYQPLPDYLMYDSTSYMYPNIQGALLQHRSKWGEVEMMCDWRGMMSKDTREAFRIIVNGKFRYKFFYFGGYVSMNHLANKIPDLPKDGVCDDLLINPLAGLDFSNRTLFSVLKLEVGYLGSYQRIRRTNVSEFQNGIRVEAELRWRFLGVKNAFFIGENLFPFYEGLGPLLNIGDPYYQSSLYNRTDLYIHILQRAFVDCYFSWNFHYVKGYKLGHQQQLLLKFNLGKVPKRDKNKTKTKKNTEE